jgi:hypothetical protein
MQILFMGHTERKTKREERELTVGVGRIKWMEPIPAAAK